MHWTILLTLLIGCYSLGFSQQGILDPSFGNNGIFFHDLSNEIEGGNFAEIQSDGKLLLANQVSQLNTDFGISRHNPDGSLDLTFGSGGFTRIFTSSSDYVIDVAFNPVNQKIYLFGYSSDYLNYSDLTVARFFNNGSLDSTFGQGGLMSYDFGNYEFLSEAKILSNGKIILAGSSWPTYPTGISNVLVVRTNEDGTIDQSFGNNGIFREPMNNYSGSASGIKELSSGDLLVSGYALDSTSSVPYLGVLKLNPNGTRIPGFGQNSRAKVVPYDGSGLTGDRMVVSGNKVYVAGSKSFIGAYEEKGTVSCIDIQTGQLLSSFGLNGTAYFKTLAQGPTEFTKVVMEGNMVVALGRLLEQNGDQLLLARFDSNGHLDSLNFGNGGYTLVNISSGYDHYADLLLGPNNKFWVTGGGNNQPNGFQTMIARFDNSAIIGFNDFIKSDYSLMVYPNPASNQFTISGDLISTTQLSLFNSFGQEFEVDYRQEGEDHVVNTSELSPGLYIVKISEGEKRYVEKVLIE